MTATQIAHYLKLCILGSSFSERELPPVSAKKEYSKALLASVSSFKYQSIAKSEGSFGPVCPPLLFSPLKLRFLKCLLMYWNIFPYTHTISLGNVVVTFLEEMY